MCGSRTVNSLLGSTRETYPRAVPLHPYTLLPHLGSWPAAPQLLITSLSALCSAWRQVPPDRPDDRKQDKSWTRRDREREADGKSFCNPNPHIQGKNMNKNMAAKPSSLSCFEAFGAILCVSLLGFWDVRGFPFCGGRKGLRLPLAMGKRV